MPSYSGFSAWVESNSNFHHSLKEGGWPLTDDYKRAFAEYAFCPYCGSGALNEVHIEGRQRKVCSECNRVLYRNPLPSVVGVALSGGKVMLVKRGVEPGIGSWCLPGGFIELGETVEEAIRRELREETGCEIKPEKAIHICTDLGGYYGDVIVVGYTISITGGEISPGDDALEVSFFPLDDIPPLTFRCHNIILNKAIGIQE